ncbi:unnamed protein product [Prunus armeniaca]|uniref:Uncharacterized protein n=2 Tax=Prunus armeniaca TaxID=36596 RepID=A0A6J5WV94_PRUAR|nr:unnamed protein product [Prunus armeniaca]
MMAQLWVRFCDLGVNEDSLLISLEYEKFPNKCSGCGSIGHLLQNCLIRHDEPEQAKMRERSRSRHC